MRNLLLAIFLVFQILCLYSVSANAQAVEIVELTDGSKIKIPINHIADEKLTSQKIIGFKVLKKEAIFIYESVSKAGFSILPGKFTKNMLAKNRTLFKKINEVSTSYSLIQNEKSFSIDGFNSIEDRALSDCKKCRVKALIVLLEIKLQGITYNIPFIESFKVL